jgi:lysophospholipase L1-like esterase
MSYRYSIAFIAFYIFLSGCIISKPTTNLFDQLPASALLPFGRTQINDNQKLELISSASHFGFSFDGTECRITASLPDWLDHNYLQYELDGIYQKRLRVSSGSNEPIVITAPKEGKHTVWIYKATEAHTGPVLIKEVSGNNIKPLQRPAAPLIEFIGNSITCGAAADPSEVPCGAGVYHDQHNAYMAYGPRVARALGVNYTVSSVSGIGIYRNWNSDGPAMPLVYGKIDFQDQNTKQWDFATYSPQVVSIALGTNDFSRGDGKKERLPFDSASFVNNYIQFVQLVRSKYPAAQIVLLSSPMINGDARIILQNCLTSVKEKANASDPSSKQIDLFFFQPMQARGCTGHPNVEDHAIMASELVPFFKKIMQ